MTILTAEGMECDYEHYRTLSTPTTIAGGTVATYSCADDGYQLEWREHVWWLDCGQEPSLRA